MFMPEYMDKGKWSICCVHTHSGPKAIFHDASLAHSCVSCSSYLVFWWFICHMQIHSVSFYLHSFQNAVFTTYTNINPCLCLCTVWMLDCEHSLFNDVRSIRCIGCLQTGGMLFIRTKFLEHLWVYSFPKRTNEKFSTCQASLWVELQVNPLKFVWGGVVLFV